MTSRFSFISHRSAHSSLPGSIAYDDPLDEYGEDETYKYLPLAALPIAIDLEEDVIDILNVLPSDLAESIIDLVADKNTLIACTLVCRAWVPRSRKHLMDMSIVRINRVKADAFVELCDSPSFSLRKIPHLELSFRGESSRMAEAVVPRLAKRRVEVEALHLEADSISSGSCGKALSLLSSTYRGRVTELSVKNYLSDPLRDVLPFVHSFGKLQMFRLVGRFNGRASAKRLPAKLERFTFMNESGSSRGTEQVLHWLSSPKDGVPSPLLELTIQGLAITDMQELQKVLDFVGRNLRCLTLTSISLGDRGEHFASFLLRHPLTGGLDYPSDLIPDLQKLHSLRYISITPHLHRHQTQTRESHALQLVMKILMSISSEFLEEVVLSIAHIPLAEFHELDFRSLDEAFNDPSTLLRVKKLTIKCHSTGILLLREWISRCQERNIVDFVAVSSI
ncbi:hypothetical protein AAF712_004723 [Marasmius tenuissimus]|uniref:F-box domain-containing protein n=1 Tax=Marasmius tenuissimus TaxID=585030 RepID=A0ABR3A380_9AGAR